MRTPRHYAWMDEQALVLPPFRRLTQQPLFPCTARILIARTIDDPSGDPVTYRVRGTSADWWVSATVRGFRASQTLHTAVELRARMWVLAIQDGRVSIGERGQPATWTVATT